MHKCFICRLEIIKKGEILGNYELVEEEKEGVLIECRVYKVE